MAPDSPVDADPKIEFLRRSAAEEVEHSGRRFLEHLVGTRDLLARWGSRPALVDAGLFHSVYGTEEFRTSLLPSTSRDDVRSLIGEEAEEIAWLWCTIGRWSLLESLDTVDGGGARARDHRNDEWIELTSRQVTDIADLWIADTIEQAPHMPASYLDYARRLLPLQNRASPEATRQLEALVPDLA